MPLCCSAWHAHPQACMLHPGCLSDAACHLALACIPTCSTHGASACSANAVLQYMHAPVRSAARMLPGQLGMHANPAISQQAIGACYAACQLPSEGEKQAAPDTPAVCSRLNTCCLQHPACIMPARTPACVPALISACAYPCSAGAACIRSLHAYRPSARMLHPACHAKSCVMDACMPPFTPLRACCQVGGVACLAILQQAPGVCYTACHLPL
jgi:hypothetical protein